MAINVRFVVKPIDLKFTISNRKPKAGDTFQQISLHFALIVISTKIGLGIITKCVNGIAEDTIQALEKFSAMATALRMALDLFTVSWNSVSGTESFTHPPPACT